MFWHLKEILENIKEMLNLAFNVQDIENSFPMRTFTMTYKTRLPWMIISIAVYISKYRWLWYKATLSDPHNELLT